MSTFRFKAALAAYGPVKPAVALKRLLRDAESYAYHQGLDLKHLTSKPISRRRDLSPAETQKWAESLTAVLIQANTGLRARGNIDHLRPNERSLLIITKTGAILKPRVLEDLRRRRKSLHDLSREDVEVQEAKSALENLHFLCTTALEIRHKNLDLGQETQPLEPKSS